MALKLISVVNGNTPEEEYVRIQVSADINIQGYALVDRSFDENGILSNDSGTSMSFTSSQLRRGIGSGFTPVRANTKARLTLEKRRITICIGALKPVSGTIMDRILPVQSKSRWSIAFKYQNPKLRNETDRKIG
ncbi:hypothetical protein EZ449_12240 [Pedobacter frigidisoli]|uniref:Uncharacterized protein n=1 Tax=Pedobacter frigidisoli TaxID=2530455 RepID=A0A4R0P3E9_9SPHI|nr:hypothetical protein [Pedobacter frigidisoli]TCD08602.1 hypothetical protein EZ449_12240 [Pedobacter frigidisoli]